MIRNTLFAAIAAIAAGTAHAQPGPVLIGGGDNMTILYPAGSLPGGGGIAGGGEAWMSGGGDDRSAVYASTHAGQAGPFAMILGGGDNAVIVYQPAATGSALALAGAGTARR